MLKVYFHPLLELGSKVLLHVNNNNQCTYLTIHVTLTPIISMHVANIGAAPLAGSKLNLSKIRGTEEPNRIDIQTIKNIEILSESAIKESLPT